MAASSQPRPQVVVIVGPTAAGKSSMALRLAQDVGGEIVNADALQVYRDLEIGTDKPTAEMRRAVPHHLVDVLDPEEPYSAGEFARRARVALAEIAGRGRTAFVVGGSGLYLRALLEGLAPVPRSDPATRARLEARLEDEGLPALRRELERVDPGTAGRLTTGDTQRTLRALEVFEVSGVTLSEWLARKPAEPPISARKLGLTVPRAILYDRIADRIHQMIERGWLAEIEMMLKRGTDPRAPAFQAIGYRQLMRHLQGEYSRQEAIDETVRATRRYAKRQFTWFRREPDIEWFSGLDIDQALSALSRDMTSKELGLDEQA
ncbi:MAG: tRNA (adenosine(37)-N6)-dimethylallyltransferase MiaA [Acidobacteriota bacterium]